MEQAELAGVPVGTYVYSTAKNTAGALKEAQLAINKMKGYKVSYPVAYDLEDSKIQKLSKKTVSEMALAFAMRSAVPDIIRLSTVIHTGMIIL